MLQVPNSSAQWDGRSIAVFGDSLATGYGLAYPGNAYPDRLRQALAGDPPTQNGSPTTVYNYSINGARVDDWLPGGRWYESSPVSWWSGRGLMDEFNRNKPTMAIVAVGLNDGYSFNPPFTADQFEANLTRLSQALRTRNPGVFLVFIHETAPSYTDLYRSYWDRTRSVASAFGPASTAIDWTAMLPYGNVAWPGFNYYQFDQVHLNDAGQIAVMNILLERLRHA